MSHSPRSHAEAVSSSTEASSAAPPEKGLSTWERERIRSRAFAMWRDDGFPKTRRREHWGLAQLQMLKGYPAG